jgi:hypothetical protein
MTGHSPRRCADDVGLDAALERSSIERSARCFQIFPVIIETIKSLLLRRLIRIGRGIQKTLLAPSRSIDKTAERRWRVGAGNLDTSRAPIEPATRARFYPTAAAKEPTTTQIAAQSPSDRSKIRIKDVPRSSRGWRARFLRLS